MWFVDKIVGYLYDAFETVYDAMWVVHGWPWPFWHLQDPLYLLALAFWYLSIDFQHFNLWLDWAAGRINSMLTWSTIYSYLKSFIDYARWAWEWVSKAWTNVYVIINTWWESTWANILEWLNDWFDWLGSRIDWLRDTLDVLRTELTSRLNAFTAQWDNFWTVIYPTLVSFSWLDAWWGSRLAEVQDLINTALKEWLPFYDELIQLWGSIVEFFTDPEEWLYKAADRIIERFW